MSAPVMDLQTSGRIEPNTTIMRITFSINHFSIFFRCPKHSINMAFFDKLLFNMLIRFMVGSFHHLENISWQALLPHFAHITNVPTYALISTCVGGSLQQVRRVQNDPSPGLREYFLFNYFGKYKFSGLGNC